MWCLKARRLVSAFLDQELDSCARSSVSHHLEECCWCRKLMARVERGSRLARSAQAVVVPPPDMGMLAAIQSGAVAAPKNTPFRWVFAVAAVAALLLVAVLVSPALWRTFWPFAGSSTVYALDFGFSHPETREDLLDAFRARYAGKFREFTYQGRLDPAWVPFAFKTASHLPPGMYLKSVMVFDPRFCGSLGLVYTDGVRNLYLLQQPADRPISLSGLKTTTNEVCKYNATHCRIGEYRVITWTHEKIRSVLLSNLDLPQIETVVASLR